MRANTYICNLQIYSSLINNEQDSKTKVYYLWLNDI